MKIVKLGDVATIDRKVVEPSLLPPDTAYLGLEHIERGGRILGYGTVAGNNITSSKFQFAPIHVLFGKLRPNLGKISRPDRSGICSTDIFPVRPGKQLDRGYLAHYLAQPDMVDYAAARTTGANLPRLNSSLLADFPLPLPHIGEQRRIAAILDRAGAIRAKRRQTLELHGELPAAVFNTMFGDVRWSSTLGDLATVQIGPFGSLLHQSDYVSDAIPVINPMHIRDGRLQPDPEFSVHESKAASLDLYRIWPGDVVLGRRGEMGRAALATVEHTGMLCGTGSLILRPRAGVDSEFLHTIVTSARMRSHLERSALGATLPNLNATIVKASPAPAAPKHAQTSFAERLRKVNAELSQAHRIEHREDEVFASLQSRAFRGEL